MPIEYKEVPQYTKAIEGRAITGIFCVHGNVDSGGDRSWPGLFAETHRAQFLWQHRSEEPPTALIKSIRDIGRAELPPAVLAKAPDASGGVEVVREYFDDAFSDRIFKAVQSGAIKEMSYAYDVIDASSEQADGQPIRNLYKADLFDISDVNWGMNDATAAMKGASWKARPFAAHSDAVEAALAAYAERARELKEARAKEGRVLSGENRKRIESAMEALAGAIDALKTLLAATEPQKNGHAETNAIRIRWIEQQQRLRELGVYP